MVEGTAKWVTASRVRLAGHGCRVGEPPEQRRSETQVRLVQDGDLILGVEVVCGCGEVTRLEFDFGPAELDRTG